MKNHQIFNKWVLTASAALGALFFLMASYVPLNYWHHSKFSNGQDFAFNDFFPFMGLVSSVFSSSQSPVLYDGNFRLYSYIAAIVLSISFILFISVVYKKSGIKGLLVILLLILSQANYLWLSVISLKLAVFSFGLALLLFAYNHEYHKKLTPVLNLVALYAILSSSLFAWFLLPVFIVASAQNKLKLISSIGTIAAAVLLVYVSNSSILVNAEMYFKNASLSFFTSNGLRLRGEDLSWSYTLSSLSQSVNLLWFVMLGLWFWLRNKEQKWYSSLGVLLAIGFLALGLLMPIIVGKASYEMLPIILCLGIVSADSISALNIKYGKWAFVGSLFIAALFGFKALWSWTQPSPYQYMQTTLPFTPSSKAITNGDGEFLNMAGISLLQHEIANASEGDTIATNFYHQLSLDKGVLIGVDFFEKDLRKYDKGVFIRLGFSPELQTSGVFPSEYSHNVVVNNGITLALSTSPQKEIKKAFKLLSQGRIGESVAKFKVLTDTFPRNTQAWYGLAMAQYNFNTWDDAMQTVQIGLGYQPNSYKMKTLLGEIYRKQNKNKKALEQWNESLKIWNVYGRTHWLLGEYYLRTDSLDKAKGYFLSAKYCNDAMQQRAMLSLQLIDSLETKKEFEKGLAKRFIARLNTFGEISDSNIIRLNSIVKELKAYTNLDSTNAELRAHLGIGYMMMQNYSKAAITFEKAVELNPNYPQMREYMVIARMNWGAEMFAKDSMEEAIFHFRYALDYSPENENVKSNLSVAYNEVAKRALNNGQLEEAYALIRAAIYYDQENAFSYLQMGLVQEEINQTDSAEIAFNQAYMLDPSNEDVLLKLLEFYKSKKDGYKVKIYTDRLNKVRRRSRTP